MARKATTINTLKALFARSGNQCAFPGCSHPIVNEKNLFVAQVCHIEAANEKGERYNQNQSDEDRRSYGNLMLMCYRHHKETDDEEEFPVPRMKQMKIEHEQRFIKTPFDIDLSVILKVKRNFEEYWTEIKYLHEYEHEAASMKIEVDVDASFFKTMDDLKMVTKWMEDRFSEFEDSDKNLTNEIIDLLKKNGKDTQWLNTMPYYQNPFDNRNWELYNIGMSNVSQKLAICLCQIEIQYLEVFLSLHPEDRSATDRLEKRKEEFKYLAQNSTLFD